MPALRSEEQMLRIVMKYCFVAVVVQLTVAKIGLAESSDGGITVDFLMGRMLLKMRKKSLRDVLETVLKYEAVVKKAWKRKVAQTL